MRNAFNISSIKTMNAILPPEELLQQLSGARRLLVSSHANPDGDAVGSELGVMHALRELGHAVTIWNADPVPSALQDLPGSQEIHLGKNPPGPLADFDAALILECPTLERTGLPVDAFSTLPLINLDHHLGNSGYGAVNWVDPEAPAVAELALHVLEALAAPINPDSALCLYCGIASDTGGFRFSNANQRAFAAASRLVSLGAAPETVSRWLFENRPRLTLELLGPLLATLEVLSDGRLAVVHLTAETMSRIGADNAHTEGLVEYPRSIEGVDVVAFLRELPDGRTKVSLRSRDGVVNVESIARSHQGGGHQNAAGCSLSLPVTEARELITQELVKALEAHR